MTRAWTVGMGVMVAASIGAPNGIGQPGGVVYSPHNLSAGGSGLVRAASESEVCIFCHAPHNATPVKPLWNRVMPSEAYSIYTSRALDALPGQPTGASKMCLSCHDGTIALGLVVSRASPIQMQGAVTTMPAGHALIGTDLRDDHPVSFRFDRALATRDIRLRSPSSLPPELRLDFNAELQCTTCHDAHNNSRGKFLVMSNASSEMCVSCHAVGSTTIAAHQDCGACHQPHSAPSGAYLLRGSTVAATCTRCHDGSVAGAPNIASDLNKPYRHDTRSDVDPPDPHRDQASCVDCHEPHTMSRGAGAAPSIHPNFGRVSGVNSSGAPVAAASAEFEVCSKCHADGTVRTPAIPRRIVQNNTRLEFQASSISFHPVQGPGRNSNVPSLRPGWTIGSTMYCSDCHASDSSRAWGGSGANGTHGSNMPWLLAARYETADFTSESAAAYALCYRCHDRASILDDRSFKEHKKHIQEERAPCAACHDAHGITSSQGSATGNTNLINFATSIVFPDPGTGRLEFRDTGRFRGECFLRCHGENHSPLRY